jgi:hypothetical protein
MNTSNNSWTQAVMASAPQLQATEVRMVLITGTDLQAVQEAALALFDAGHIPLVGEWFASPMAALPACGAAFEDLYEPLAERLLMRADAVLRLEGTSAFADSLVSSARSQGMRVFFSLDDVLAG